MWRNRAASPCWQRRVPRGVLFSPHWDECWQLKGRGKQRWLGVRQRVQSPVAQLAKLTLGKGLFCPTVLSGLC